MQSPSLLSSQLLHQLQDRQPGAAQLLSLSEDEQHRLGYFHTLREICQQPATWLETGRLLPKYSSALIDCTEGLSSLFLTGSGSSEYAGDCVRSALRKALNMDVQAIPSGALLTHVGYAMPVARPSLMVSLARSGDSPESVGALTLVRKIAPEIRHLVLTCNREGKLAKTFNNDPNVVVIALDAATNDRSLVMTSSFTNMVLGVRFIGLLRDSSRYASICHSLAQSASALLLEQFDLLSAIAAKPFRRALFLGSGAHFAAAREASLKMLEMTSGRVSATSETFLGLRHGPMSGVHDDTLVVSFLSSDPTIRAYESDVLKELEQKKLGMIRCIAGHAVPEDLVDGSNFAIQYRGLGAIDDNDLPVMDVVVGQLFGFFRCFAEGLKPDSPSSDGVIHRVVKGFALHLPTT
jgi:tagatose-6-phosphate ketose/aldose isomerase